MLLAVFAASPKSISLSLTKPWAKMPARMVSRKRAPMVRARRRGDVCADISADYADYAEMVHTNGARRRKNHRGRRQTLSSKAAARVRVREIHNRRTLFSYIFLALLLNSLPQGRSQGSLKSDSSLDS